MSNINTEVNKAMSPEEMTVISNIKSQLDQLLSMGGNGAPPAAPPGEQAPPVAMSQNPTMKAEDAVDIGDMEDGVDKEEDDMEEVDKGLESTPSESSTASDDATPRMEEPQSDPSEENVNEVAKAFLQLIQKGQNKPVQKQQTPLMATLQTVQRVVDVQKAQEKKQVELETALNGILKGLGVMDQLDIAKSRVPKSVPITTQDNNPTLDMIVKALTQAQGQNQSQVSQNNVVQKSQHEIARGNLNDLSVLSGMVG